MDRKRTDDNDYLKTIFLIYKIRGIDGGSDIIE